MLLALYTIFVLGGGGTFGPIVLFDQALDNAKVVIVEDDRRKEAKTTLKAMKKRSSDYTKAGKKLANNLGFEKDDRHLSDDDVEVFWDKLLELNSQYSDDIVEMRFGLRDQLSSEEWAGLFPEQDSASGS
jgi:hypothetical protein